MSEEVMDRDTFLNGMTGFMGMDFIDFTIMKVCANNANATDVQVANLVKEEMAKIFSITPRTITNRRKKLIEEFPGSGQILRKYAKSYKCRERAMEPMEADL